MNIARKNTKKLKPKSAKYKKIERISRVLFYVCSFASVFVSALILIVASRSTENRNEELTELDRVLANGPVTKQPITLIRAFNSDNPDSAKLFKTIKN